MKCRQKEREEKHIEGNVSRGAQGVSYPYIVVDTRRTGVDLDVSFPLFLADRIIIVAGNLGQKEWPY